MQSPPLIRVHSYFNPALLITSRFSYFSLQRDDAGAAAKSDAISLLYFISSPPIYLWQLSFGCYFLRFFFMASDKVAHTHTSPAAAGDRPASLRRGLSPSRSHWLLGLRFSLLDIHSHSVPLVYHSYRRNNYTPVLCSSSVPFPFGPISFLFLPCGPLCCCFLYLCVFFPFFFSFACSFPMSQLYVPIDTLSFTQLHSAFAPVAVYIDIRSMKYINKYIYIRTVFGETTGKSLETWKS